MWDLAWCDIYSKFMDVVCIMQYSKNIAAIIWNHGSLKYDRCTLQNMPYVKYQSILLQYMFLS